MINKELQLHFENELRLIINNDSSKTTKLIFRKDKTPAQKKKINDMLTKHGFKTVGDRSYNNGTRTIILTDSSIRITG